MKNKILTISIVFILISFTLVSNVFAYNESFTFNDVEYSSYLPDGAYNVFITLDEYTSGNYNYFVSCSNGWAKIYFWEKENDIKFWLPDGLFTAQAGGTSISTDLSNYSYIKYMVKEDGNNLYQDTSGSIISSFYCSNNNLYFLTNINIYTDETCTDFFFEAPVTEQQEKGTLAPILEKVEMQEPIVTTIVGLAKLLIPLLACLIGLWKAWHLVSNLLHKA